jgi:hypothetical protein
VSRRRSSPHRARTPRAGTLLEPLGRGRGRETLG